MIHGSDPKVIEFAMIHIRASGPVSAGSLKGWLQDQLPGCDSGNVDRLTREFIDFAAHQGFVECDEHGYIDAVVTGIQVDEYLAARGI